MLFLLLLALSSATFVATKSTYNGTVSYDGLFQACDKEFKKSKPCNNFSLLNGFWNVSLPPSWILALDVNCQGYTSDSLESIGNCVDTSLGYVTVCSCNMYMPICCYY